MSFSVAAWLPAVLNCCIDVVVSTPRRLPYVVSSAPAVVKRMSPKALSPFASTTVPPTTIRPSDCSATALTVKCSALGNFALTLPVAAERRVQRPVGLVARDGDELALRAADVDVAGDDEAPVGHDREAGRARLPGLEGRAHPAADAERRIELAVGVETLDGERRVGERPVDSRRQQHRRGSR